MKASLAPPPCCNCRAHCRARVQQGGGRVRRTGADLLPLQRERGQGVRQGRGVRRAARRRRQHRRRAHGQRHGGQRLLLRQVELLRLLDQQHVHAAARPGSRHACTRRPGAAVARSGSRHACARWPGVATARSGARTSARGAAGAARCASAQRTRQLHRQVGGAAWLCVRAQTVRGLRASGRSRRRVHAAHTRRASGRI